MTKYQKKYRIESTRIPEFDYSRGGYYFVTICTHKRQNLFGEIERDKMILNDAGKIAEKCIQNIPCHFPNANYDYYCVMPNHLHLIIIIDNSGSVETQNFVSLQNQFQRIIPFSIGSIVKGLKIGVTKWFRNNNNHNPIWQRNFYEHIIRNEKELYNVRNYIKLNPLQWDLDEENIINIKM